MTWQPIETAPRDGTEIWAFNGEQARMRWIEGYGLWSFDDELFGPAPEQPSHWQPLPPPPTQEKK